MYKKISLAITLSFVFLISSCVTELPVAPTTELYGLQTSQVKQSILRGAAIAGWDTWQVKPGYIVATYEKNDQIACVDIRYTRLGYKITMNPKTNMDTENGQVDSKYNQWVEALNNEIKHMAGYGSSLIKETRYIE